MRAAILILLVASTAVAAPIWPKTPLERSARDAVNYSQNYIATVQTEHPNVSVAKANQARTEVISALAVYCNGSAYLSGGKCEKAKDGKVRAATATNLRLKLDILENETAALEPTH
jgi:hypothetical protein